ncbi:MAG: undecaprenyldiphospho-muramoylpentapeptide beta-N-acetylglucosaminyltransferase, partial [Fusobacteriaceae bacterium]
TGGHIYPALSVADELVKKNIEVLFVGTTTRIENKLVPEKGYKFIGINFYPPKNIKTIFLFLKAIKISFNIVRKEKPDAIIGFGNYISAPFIIAGILLRKKVFLQEQNADMGLMNKIFYRFSKKIFLAFDSTYDKIPIKYSKKLLVTGNPLRSEIYELQRESVRENLKVKDNEKILLIIGGSLGAKNINDSVIELWSKIHENKNLRIYWSTGDGAYDEVIKKVQKTKANDVIKPYFNNVIEIMVASDLIIGRAGALTVSEIIQLEKPSVLIPFPSKKVGQYENAKILEEIKASYIYKNMDSEKAVLKALEIIMDEKKLEEMRVKTKILKKENAARIIVEEICM